MPVALQVQEDGADDVSICSTSSALSAPSSMYISLPPSPIVAPPPPPPPDAPAGLAPLPAEHIIDIPHELQPAAAAPGLQAAGPDPEAARLGSALVSKSPPWCCIRRSLHLCVFSANGCMPSGPGAMCGPSQISVVALLTNVLLCVDQEHHSQRPGLVYSQAARDSGETAAGLGAFSLLLYPFFVRTSIPFCPKCQVHLCAITELSRSCQICMQSSFSTALL